MNTPIPQLMAFYGTDRYFLEKSGQLPTNLLKEYGPGLLSMAVASSDQGHQEEVLANAEEMNLLFRAAERERMAATNAGFKGAAALRPDLNEAASALGRKLAHASVKEAAPLLASLGELIPGALRAGGKLLGGAGKALGGTGALGAAGGALRQAGTGMRAAALGRAAAPAAMGIPKAVQQGFTAGLPGVAKASPWAAAGERSLMQKALSGQAAPGVAAAASSAGKPLLSGLTKAKIGVGAGLLGAGYLGYKGLQKSRDFMMTPPEQKTWGHNTPAPLHNTNEWGTAF